MKILKKGKIKGYEYIIVENKLGEFQWFCGYIKLKENSKYLTVPCEDIPIMCIGGLTFKDNKALWLGIGTWIGFDTNHCFYKGIKLDTVKNECEYIINQLLELDN